MTDQIPQPPHGILEIDKSADGALLSWPWLLLALLLIVVLITLVMKYKPQKKPKVKTIQEKIEDEREALANLKHSEMETNAGLTAISTGMRLSLSYIVSLSLKDMTFQEIERTLPRQWPSTKPVGNFLGLLHEIDMAIYSPGSISIDEATRIKKQALEWMDVFRDLGRVQK